MKNEIKKLHLSIENIGLDEIDYENDHTDVIIDKVNGDRYIATFFTFKNFDELKSKSKVNGEFLRGRYFWVDRMIFIENIKKETILEVVEYLIDEGDFERVFEKIK